MFPRNTSNFRKKPSHSLPILAMNLSLKVERPPGLNREEWLDKLEQVNQSLRKQGATAQLVLIGGATGIFAGQPARTSIDLDVWKPRSRT